MTPIDQVNVLSVPESFILSVLESNISSFDQHNCITSNTALVGKIFLNLIGKDTQWTNVEFEFTNRTSNIVVKRQLQVICISGLTTDILLSEDDTFNLMKTACPSSDVPYIKPQCKLKFDQDYHRKPIKAVEVKICLLNNMTNFDWGIVDIILLKYFKYPRFVYKDDVFCVDVVKYFPEIQYTKGNNNFKSIYFKVCDIKGPQNYNASSDSGTGYVVDDTVSLYQLTTQNSFVPSVAWLVCNHNFYKNELTVKDFLKPLLPVNLHVYAERLISFFHPFMAYKLEELQLKPLFVVNGPLGCGKTLLVSSIAKRLGLHYWRVECSSLIVGPSGFNEAKFKTIFTKMKKFLPCLLQLSNIEVLCEDREGNKDVRIVSYLSRLLTEMKCDLPFIVVGTTSYSDKLSNALLQSVLHIINIDSLSLEERADAISWICQLPQPVALKVAARTSGFTLSDLTFLVSQTSREKYKLTRDHARDRKSNQIEYEDFVLIIDRMVAQTANAIGAPHVPAVAWTDVGGHNEIKKEIVRSLNTADFGTGLRRSGILLWGPPGTGKTLLAKAVANECKSTFLSVKGPELLNMYVGQSEHNVRQVFERAREAAPCIIFFDELDSLAPNRGKGDSAGVMDRVVSQLLSEMDGLQKNDGVFVLGATNRPDLIDPALLRPGRLDKMLYVGPCEGTEAKLSVLKALTRKYKMTAEVDLYKIAESLPPCLTGAELYSVCYNAWQSAARTVIKRMQSSNDESSETVIVSASDFSAAVDNLLLAS